MSLTGSQIQQVHKALLSAFPTHDALARMLRFELDVKLEEIATGNLSDVVYDLLTWAESQGRVEELLTGARKANSGNPELQAVARVLQRPTAPSQAQSRPVTPADTHASGGTTASGAGSIAIGGNVQGSVLVTGSNNRVGTQPPQNPSPPPTQGHPALEVFFSYSHKDEKLRDQLEIHLALLKRQGVIAGWHDRKISAGTEWAGQIDQHLNTAGIILLLVSADFLASDYCYDLELTRAMERHEAGEARVIPVILRPCDWQMAPFGKLQALPTDGKPIIRWSDRDTAFLNVAQGIRKVATELTANP